MLSKFYADPDDIDLFVGGSLELNLPNALVGPTFHCIFVKQFSLTRDADLYFYTSSGLPSSFTAGTINYRMTRHLTDFRVTKILN